MTLRTRVTLAAGLAVLLAVVAVSTTVYVIMRGTLYRQIDESLSHNRPASGSEQHSVPPDASAVPEHLPPAQQVFRQEVDRDGTIVAMVGDRRLPVTAEVLAVARGERRDAFFDVDVAGTPVRVYVASAGPGMALQVGRSLTEVEQALRQLVLTLVVISVVAVGLAAVIGRLVAAAAVAPVHRVAEAADAVARTGDLSVHLAVAGGDDLGRLAASFNTMLDALSESLAQQRRLVADASHELRTPLATVRTNVEVLARAEELARGDGQEEPFTLVDLADLTRRAVDVVGRNHPSITFRVDGVPSLIRGAPARVSRAVSNLIDNAAKWSPPGAEVEVTVHDGAVTVRDHGPGVAAADLPHVFDRFYRSPQARTMPGSGLGLAIVKQVADSHVATVTAGAAPGGGALFVLRFPTADGAGTNPAETS